MSNLNNPQGLIPHGKIFRARTYVAGGTVYPGDAVKLDSAGKVVVVAAGAAAVLGAALTYATTGQDISVCDDPDQIYRIKSDDATEPAAQTAINLNYNIVATSGSTGYKCSRMALDGSTGVSDSNMPLKLLAVESRPDNAYGAYADCIVILNNGHLKGGTGTLGV
jgi:hypothetical protein